MKKTRRFGLVVLALLVVCVFTACGSEEARGTPSADHSASAGEENRTADKDLYNIGFVVADLSHPFVADFVKGLYRAEEELQDRASFHIIDGQGDQVVQTAAMEQFIMQEMDCIILAPIDATALIPVVEQANDVDIPVICVNAKVDGGSFVYVGSNDFEAGHMQGAWVAENAPENAKYLYMYLQMGQSGQILREEGFLEAIKDRTDLELISAQTAMGFRDQAMKLMEDWIQAYNDDIDMVVFQTETMALGALEAMRDAGLSDVVITTVDVSLESIEALKSGEISVCIFQDAMAQAYQACHVAVELLDGKFHDEEQIIPFRYVTKENADSFIQYYAADTYDPQIFDNL